MSKTSPQLTWCVVRFGKDMNWWVKEISDPVRWDVDSLSIIDPRQVGYILDLLDGLRDYGLSTEIVENAFIPFQIQAINPDKTARLVRVNETFFDTTEELFALPDILDEEKGAYAEFLDHITLLRTKYLNDKLDFAQKLTVTELEEQIRDSQTQAFMEGRATHLFQEIVDILEFVPEGYELSVDDDDEKIKAKSEEDFTAVNDMPDFDDENLDEDEAMRLKEMDGDEDDTDSADDFGDADGDAPAEEDAAPRKKSSSGSSSKRSRKKR